jgi:diphosphomevalonate decarboxylase
MTIATARAHPNIAFIKYWGNANDALKLPENPSISMNLADLHTTTTVEWTELEKEDVLTINGERQQDQPLLRVSKHLERIRALAGIDERAIVSSINNFPTGAGIASSASAFAALTVAASSAAGLHLSQDRLSSEARMGSGSAARSVPGGFVVWHMGREHLSSFAESIAPADHWDLVDVIAVVDRSHKQVGSHDGHALASTSDLHAARLAGAQSRYNECVEAIRTRSFDGLAAVIELDSNLMHSVMMTSHPALMYWRPGTLEVMHCVYELRTSGVKVAYTVDAGPNVHLITLRDTVGPVTKRLKATSHVAQIITSGVGEGASVLSLE